MKKTRACEKDGLQEEANLYETLLLTYAEDRAIVIDEEITPKMIRTVLVPLLRMDKDEDENPIDIYLNTPGGDAQTTLAICTAIDNLKCPTTVHILGCAYSGGLWIASAGRHNPNVTKVAYSTAEFLYHRVSMGMEGSLSEIEVEYGHSQSIQARLNDYLLEHSTLDAKTLGKYKSADWFFDAKTALKYGIVDEVL